MIATDNILHIFITHSIFCFLLAFNHTGKAFKISICKRLLHSGASTSQILEMYVSMIRALRVLDPSDLVLNFIAAPVRTYLMERKDTVRCIVSSLTKNKDSDLHGKLVSICYGVRVLDLFVSDLDKALLM